MSLVLFTEGTTHGETSQKSLHSYTVKCEGERNMGMEERGRKGGIGQKMTKEEYKRNEER